MLVPLRGREGCYPYWVPKAAVLTPGAQWPWKCECLSMQHSLRLGGKLSSLQNRMSVNSTNRSVKDVGSVSVLPEEPSWRNFTLFFVSSEVCWLAVSTVVSRLYMCHWKDVFILGSCGMIVMVKTLKVPSWEYVGMHAFMLTYTCAQEPDRQWWEAGGLELSSSHTAGGTGSCALFTDEMAFPACIGFGLAALLGSGVGLFVRWDWDSFSYMKECYAMGFTEICRVECVSW